MLDANFLYQSKSIHSSSLKFLLFLRRSEMSCASKFFLAFYSYEMKFIFTCPMLFSEVDLDVFIDFDMTVLYCSEFSVLTGLKLCCLSMCLIVRVFRGLCCFSHARGEVMSITDCARSRAVFLETVILCNYSMLLPLLLFTGDSLS